MVLFLKFVFLFEPSLTFFATKSWTLFVDKTKLNFATIQILLLFTTKTTNKGIKKFIEKEEFYHGGYHY